MGTVVVTSDLATATADAESSAAADDIRVVLVEPSGGPVDGSGG
jgi:hypothetical protein